MCVLCCILVGQASKNTFEWWLSHWTSTATADDELSGQHLLTYVFLGILACIFHFTWAFL